MVSVDSTAEHIANAGSVDGVQYHHIPRHCTVTSQVAKENVYYENDHLSRRERECPPPAVRATSRLKLLHQSSPGGEARSPGTRAARTGYEGRLPGHPWRAS